MTKVNSKVKIHYVDPLFVGSDFKTEVYLSDAAQGDLSAFAKEEHGRRFFKKLKEYAKSGFSSYEGGPIRHEWDGVFRIAHANSMFRLIGFYDGGKLRFIGIDSFRKRKQGLSVTEQDRISEVARVRQQRRWVFRKQ